MRQNPNSQLRDDQWEQLANAAWDCRNNAYPHGKTKVGAAVLSKDGRMFVGCNVEHRYRCHDIHAEVNALSTMVASGCAEMVAIIVVAERERFTPCGGCMDWIFQFGGPKCLIGIRSSLKGDLEVFRAEELMPHYPPLSA